MAATAQRQSRRPEGNPLDVIVVGAGFAGLYLLHRLRRAGFSVLVIEAGSDVGGTWYWNRYPGARCDVESLEYSYSFSEELQQEWTWRERFATQPEILAYLQHVADRFDLRRDIRFGTRVVSALFDEATAAWTVRTDGGDEVTARFCVMATGSITTPRLPDIPGITSFTGEIHHTARWPKAGVDVAGKRVGVIGTGSSGIQVIPVLAESAAHLTVFQRTPAYSIPARNHPLAPEHVAAWKAEYPAKRAAARETRNGVLYEYATSAALETPADVRVAELERRWAKGGANFMHAYNDFGRNETANEIAASFVRDKIARTVRDPRTARKLMPADYPIGAKRICIDTGYFETYNRPNVTLVDLREDPIRAVTADAIETALGRHPIDILVLATGFDAMTGALLAMDIGTRGGTTLKALWTDGPRTYLGLMTAGLPNLFMVNGPGSPSVLSNMVVSIEHHVAWICDCIAMLRVGGARTIEADPEAQDAWVSHVAEVASGTLYPRANSWYVGANVPGKPRVFMPYVGGVDAYQRTCREVVEAGYRGFRIDTRSADAARVAE
jgi:cyclohexanone monooxygenase